MLNSILLSMKRKMLIRKFRSFEVKHRAQYVGEEMARGVGESGLGSTRARLNDAIQEVCAKNDIGHEEMNLIEDDLNVYINDLVREAFDAESKKLEKRELVDSRIKIKRAKG